jgi:membrane protein required for colicin V production
MNWADYAIIAILIVSAVVGLARGLIREVVSLGVWVAALLIAWAFHREVADMLTAQLSQPGLRLGVAFIALVVVTLFLGAIIGALLTAVVDKAGLTVLDRAFGLLFGAARGALIAAMLVFLVALTPVPEEMWWKESRLIGEFQTLASNILDLVPDSIHTRLKQL